MPTFTLTVQYATEHPCPQRPQLRRWVATTLAALPKARLRAIKEIALVLRFVDTEEGLGLNQGFRKKKYATNVLTFSYEMPKAIAADIVICAPVIEQEAGAQAKPLKNHYAHMVVHGVLHACGYDHEVMHEAEAMESLETHILARYRIVDPYRKVGRVTYR